MTLMISGPDATDAPATRPLKVYAFDPSQGRSFGNYMTLNVPYEPLRPGPVGSHVQVIDYDASREVYCRPVDLDDPAVLLRGGFDPSESDPRFHQQMVYAVTSATIRRFAFALGRPAKWHRSIGERLRILPHAMQEANAFYSRDLGALAFGYFEASRTDPGANLPGQIVFSCLSYDIVAHEVAHALVDGQKAYFLEPTSADTLAFHEAFADLVALFEHFTHKEALLETIRRTGGLVYRAALRPDVSPGDGGALLQAELSPSNPLVQLARQFGEAMGTRKALRAALGTRPDSSEMDRRFEPHERGSILVAAVFDAFFSVYLRRTRDLMRIASAGGSIGADGEVHPDLAIRLAGEAHKTAEHFANICIRALDFCPPVDIQFGDFLRAMITADQELVPDDPYGYRAGLIEAFRLRGIRPAGVPSYAEESLRWSAPGELHGATPPVCDGLSFDVFDDQTPEQQKANAVRLSRYGREHAALLGLEPGVPVQAFSFRPIHRVGPDGQLRVELVAELLQRRRNVPLDPDDPDSPRFTYRGGATLVLDRHGGVRFAIEKPLGGAGAPHERLERQRGYLRWLDASYARATYLDRAPRRDAGRRPLSLLDAAPGGPLQLGFGVVHRGY